MTIEKRNIKNFNVIIIIVLAAILVAAFGGIVMQRQPMSARGNGVEMGRDTILSVLQPESALSGPTGTLVLSAGIILLLVGFGVLVAMVWAKRNRPHG